MTTDADILARARGALERGLKAIDACIEKVESMVLGDDAEYDSKLASHLAYLSEKLSPMVREFRQLEKHDADAAKNLTPEERVIAIVQQIRDLPRENRVQVMERAQGLASEGAMSR